MHLLSVLYLGVDDSPMLSDTWLGGLFLSPMTHLTG